jgi:hypothetical protein
METPVCPSQQRGDRERYSDLRVKCPLFSLNFNKNRISVTLSSISRHENPSRGSQVISSGDTDGRIDRETDMMKLEGVFAIIANMPGKFRHIKLNMEVGKTGYKWETAHGTCYHCN